MKAFRSFCKYIVGQKFCVLQPHRRLFCWRHLPMQLDPFDTCLSCNQEIYYATDLWSDSLSLARIVVPFLDMR
jgi:hypothetical protein